MVEIARSRRPDAAFEVGDALAPRPGFERLFSAHFYGHLDAAQREAFLALPRSAELVVVDSALRPGGVAEDWQERVLDDGSRHSRLQALVHRARGWRRRSAAPRCSRRAVVRRRQKFEPALLNDAPWRALAEREVRRERRAAVPGVRDPLRHRRAVLEAVARAAADEPDGARAPGAGAAMKWLSAEIS